jgi:uroporphyrinogen decarboxylase
LIHELLKYCNESVLEFIKAIKSVGAHVTTIGDSISGPDVISPKDYSEYSFPYKKILTEEVKKLGIGFSIHICGNTDVIFDKWLQTGADIFEIDHKTNFKEARKKSLGKVCLLGNLDTSSVLFQGTPKLVKEKAKEIIDTCMPFSGLILSSGCLIGGTTPYENIQALADSAKEFGVFKN